MRLIYLFLLLFLPFWLQAQNISWQQLETGLEYAIVNAPKKSDYGDSKIHVLRINPDHFSFQLISSKEKGESNKTAKAWAVDRGLTAVINAGMYMTDHQTNVGYFRNYDFVNSSRVNSNNAVVAFNPKDPGLPAFQIIDRKCQDWETLKTQYNSLVQGIRMIDCNQKNRWSQQPKKWSMVVIAADKAGNALFIHSRSPYSVHDFINILLQLPLNVHNAMYLEGGPEASFYLKSNSTETEQFGSFETGFVENDGNNHAWPLPNVIGIQPKH